MWRILCGQKYLILLDKFLEIIYSCFIHDKYDIAEY